MVKEWYGFLSVVRGGKIIIRCDYGSWHHKSWTLRDHQPKEVPMTLDIDSLFSIGFGCLTLGNRYSSGL